MYRNEHKDAPLDYCKCGPPCASRPRTITRISSCPDVEIKVLRDGWIEIDGEVITEPRDIGEAFQEWAQYMAGHNPALPLSDLRALQYDLLKSLRAR